MCGKVEVVVKTGVVVCAAGKQIESYGESEESSERGRRLEGTDQMRGEYEGNEMYLQK